MFTFWAEFECFFSMFKNLTFYLHWLSIIPKQLGVGYDYQVVFFKSWLYVWLVVETGITSWKRSYLLMPSSLIYVYFRNYFCWYHQNSKIGKVINFLVKSIDLWKKISIPRYDMIIFTCKSWWVKSCWLTLSLRLKVTRGDSFDFKTLLNILGLKEQSFKQVHCLF